jgi:hypothetical protein
MKYTNFDWQSGTVAFWDLDEINEAQSLNAQIEHLKEDLAQISFPDLITIDLGWYPSFDPKGEFKIVVIHKGDWENPIFRSEAKDIPTLKRQISLAILLSI